MLGTSALMAPHAEAAGKSLHGCPGGGVCIYPTKGGLKVGPERGGIFFSYGAHNLTEQLGNHIIVNNQYDGAGFRMCYGYGGRDCFVSSRHRGDFITTNLTEVNAFKLFR